MIRHNLDVFAYPYVYGRMIRLWWYTTCQCGRLFGGPYPSQTMAAEMGRLHQWEYRRTWHRAHEAWPQLR